MQPPDHNRVQANCPPGLEHLAVMPEIYIQQKLSWMESKCLVFHRLPFHWIFLLSCYPECPNATVGNLTCHQINLLVAFLSAYCNKNWGLHLHLIFSSGGASHRNWRRQSWMGFQDHAWKNLLGQAFFTLRKCSIHLQEAHCPNFLSYLRNMIHYLLFFVCMF